MKKRRFLASFFALCMFLSASNISAFAAENEDVTVQPPIVIGRYDGPLYGFEDSGEPNPRIITTARVNSYATYDSKNGVRVHITLYASPFEDPQFTSMAGDVNVDLSGESTKTEFLEFADGERSIETDVDTGATGKKGDKGRISVEGVATANKSLSGGGEFNIAYSITIP